MGCVRRVGCVWLRVYGVCHKPVQKQRRTLFTLFKPPFPPSVRVACLFQTPRALIVFIDIVSIFLLVAWIPSFLLSPERRWKWRDRGHQKPLKHGVHPQIITPRRGRGGGMMLSARARVLSLSRRRSLSSSPPPSSFHHFYIAPPQSMGGTRPVDLSLSMDPSISLSLSLSPSLSLSLKRLIRMALWREGRR